jgi:hypothetical protein
MNFLELLPHARRYLALTALAAVGCGDASAQQNPRNYASSTPSGSVSALPPEEQAKVIDGHKPWVPIRFNGAFPSEASEKPKKAEWSTAPMATDVRITQPGCKVQRIREWYRFTCELKGAMLVTGSAKDVDFIVEKDVHGPDGFAKTTILTFPVRRGDKRLFQFYRWSKWAPGQPDATLSEQFLEGDEAPLITLEGLRWDF